MMISITDRSHLYWYMVLQEMEQSGGVGDEASQLIEKSDSCSEDGQHVECQATGGAAS